MNNGNGTFASKVDYSVGAGTADVVLADLNGDGKADVITGGGSTPNIYVRMNNGDGTFGATTSYVSGVSTLASSLEAADLNNDGAIDIAVQNTNGNTVSVFMNTGNGTLAAKVDYSSSDGYGLAVVDVNGDGYVDLVPGIYSSPSAGFAILYNNGNGTFGSRVIMSTGVSGYTIAAGDLNNDGKPDVVTGVLTNGTINVILSNPRTMIHANAFTGLVSIGTSTATSSNNAILYIANSSSTSATDLLKVSSSTGLVAFNVASNGSVQVGTSTKYGTFNLQAIATTSPIFSLASSTGANVLTITADGNMGIGTTTASAAVTVQGGAGANIFSLNTSAGANVLNINSTGRLSVATTAAVYGTELALNGLGSLRLSSPVGSDNIFTFNSRGVDNFSIRGTNGADAYLNSVNNSTLFLGAASTPAGAIVNQMAFRPDGRITVGGGTVQAAGNILSIASSTITGTNALLSIGTSTTGSILNVLASGQMLIGTTTATTTGVASKLTIAGSGVGGDSALWINNFGASSGWAARFTPVNNGGHYFRFDNASSTQVGHIANVGTNGTAIELAALGDLQFASGGSNRLYVASTTGFIGIGTTTPDQLISLNGNNAAIGIRNTGNGSMGWLSKFTDRFALASANDVILYASSTNGTDGTALRLTQSGTLSLIGSLSTLGFSTGVDGVEKNTINYSNGGARAIEFDGSGTTNVLRLYAGNDGSVAERATLDVNGNLQIGKGGTTGCLTDGDGTNLAGTCASDENLKTNILTLDTADMLNKISGMNPVTYNWKDNATGTAQYGIIAQQIESVAPEFVVTDENGGKKVHFDMFNTYFIGAIKELNKKMFASGPQTALTIEEITASSTISVDDKLKALANTS
jgi:hypothetical protein